MNFKGLLARFGILYNSRKIYLNEDGSILTWKDRLQKEKELTQEQAVGRYFSCLYADRDADRECYDQLITLAGVKGTACKVIPSNDRKSSCKIRLDAIKGDEGVVLGFTITER